VTYVFFGHVNVIHIFSLVNTLKVYSTSVRTQQTISDVGRERLSKV